MSNLSIFFKKITLHTYVVIFIMTIGIFVRGWMLGKVPGGVNVDEAFGAYEAYSILHYGVDSWGYAFPVYLNTWGNGMSALNTYLTIPFIALFGLKVWVIRIPQFLTACFTLYVTYKLLLKLFNEKAAVIGLFFLAICPWHIMMSRWSLDCNLAPSFLLFGFYFFVLAVEQPKYYILSALFYGLSLYCYATIWPIVPLMIFLQLLYLWYTKKLHFSWYAMAAVLILALLALPLILFLLINYGYLEEIRLPFLSIPKVTVVRQSDISFFHKRQKLQTLISLFLEQNDGLYWNSTVEFGLYYSKWVLVFGIIGFVYCCKNALISIWKHTYDSTVLLIIPFMCALLLGILISVNVNRINCIHLPTILFIAIGLYLVIQFLTRLLKRHGKYVLVVFTGIACIYFLRFEYFYFTTYKENISSIFLEGLEGAVNYAIALAGDGQDIFVDDSISYSQLMFYSRPPVTEYLNSTQYEEYRRNCQKLPQGGAFRFELAEAVPGQICIIPSNTIDTFWAEGWKIEQFEYVAVAY